MSAIFSLNSFLALDLLAHQQRKASLFQLSATMGIYMRGVYLLYKDDNVPVCRIKQYSFDEYQIVNLLKKLWRSGKSASEI